VLARQVDILNEPAGDPRRLQTHEQQRGLLLLDQVLDAVVGRRGEPDFDPPHEMAFSRFFHGYRRPQPASSLNFDLYGPWAAASLGVTAATF
jgi:hypothetical protein